MTPAIVTPSLETVRDIFAKSEGAANAPNLVPLTASIPADLLTPTLAYLKLSQGFIGADPHHVIKTGPGYCPESDPLPLLEKELLKYRVASTSGVISLPPMAGGAVGYVGYDCIRYFEPKTARPMEDVLKIPEAMFMFFDTLVAFDHFFQQIKIITYLHINGGDDDSKTDIAQAYEKGREIIEKQIKLLLSPEVPLPPQPPIQQGQVYTSNIGREGYEAHVKRLKEHIAKGDIFQCVPSQRLARPTTLHPFNLFRHLRTVNPSPYLFYIDCEAFQLVGASPELLVQAKDRRIITHPIAGTVKRGKTPEEDEVLAEGLRSSLKDRAEHVMLVDLARNDINRVCRPETCQVDRLMVVEKFSHVQHLVSQVSGILREGKTRFDAFRSIFPAGTVSGAPKVRAMTLIAELEKEKRGVYAGAVGYWGYDSSSPDGTEVYEGTMDTCIALRTMLVKDQVAYLQAGGGIVFDSDPYEEYVETLNKLGANIQCVTKAEERYLELQRQEAGEESQSQVQGRKGR
ncbi:hypothetical protein KEM54_005931 [Ascosphaera aggregata]|nr:hypothetical protein KEM54_005931 [Ascosphaera aggregata]